MSTHLLLCLLFIQNIFSHFWLVKTTCIIHQNQLPLTKFGNNFVTLNRWRQNDNKSAWLQDMNRLPWKHWEKVELFWLEQNGGTVGGTFCSFHGKILSYNMAKTRWRRTTSAIWSKSADLNRPLYPKLPDKDVLSMWTYIDQS